MPNGIYLYDEIRPGNSSYFRHLPNIRQPVNVHPGTVRHLTDAVMRRTRIFTPVFGLNVCYIHVTDDIVVNRNVLTDKEPGIIRNWKEKSRSWFLIVEILVKYTWEAVQCPGELRRRVSSSDAF